MPRSHALPCLLSISIALLSLAGCEKSVSSSGARGAGASVSSSKKMTQLSERATKVSKELAGKVAQLPAVPQQGSTELIEFIALFEQKLEAQKAAASKLLAEAESTGGAIESASRAEVDRLAQEWEQAKKKLTMLAVSGIRESKGGYTGTDRISGEEIVLALAEPPQRVGNTLVYKDVEGMFRRDGDAEITNRNGAKRDVPRFVEGDISLARVHQAAVAEVGEIAQGLAEGRRKAGAEALATWDKERLRLAARLKERVEAEVAAAENKAKESYRLSETSPQDRASRFATKAVTLLGAGNGEAELSKEFARAIEVDAVSAAKARSALDVNVRAAVDELSLKLKGSQAFSSVVTENNLHSRSLADFDTAQKKYAEEVERAVMEEARKILALKRAEAETKVKEAIDRASSAAARLEPEETAYLAKLKDGLSQEMSRPGACERVASVIAEAGRIDESAMSIIRGALESETRQASAAVEMLIAAVPGLRTEAGTPASASLTEFDASRREYLRRRQEAVASSAEKLIAAQAAAAGYVSLVSSVRPIAYFADGDAVLSLAATPTAAQFKLCVLQNGALAQSITLTFDAAEGTPVEFRRLGVFLLVGHGEQVAVLAQEYKLAGTIAGCSVADAAMLGNDLAIAGGEPGNMETGRLSLVSPSGMLRKAQVEGVDLVKPGVAGDGAIIAFVAAGGQFGSIEKLAVFDAMGGKYSPTLEPILNRVMGLEVKEGRWSTGRGAESPLRMDNSSPLHMRVVRGRIWAFAPRGLDNEKGGPCAFEIKLDGSMGTSLFAHSITGQQYAWKYEPQLVGNTRMIVQDALLGETGILVVGNSAGDSAGKVLITMLRYDGQELWAEKFDGRVRIPEAAQEAVKRNRSKIDAVLKESATAAVQPSSDVRFASAAITQEGQRLRMASCVQAAADKKAVWAYLVTDQDRPSTKAPTSFTSGGWVYFGEQGISTLRLR